VEDRGGEGRGGEGWPVGATALAIPMNVAGDSMRANLSAAWLTNR
jgi:hypothetical protein